MLALHICFRHLGLKWPLHDHDAVEIWTTHSQLLATLPGSLIRHLVELHLGGAAIHRDIQALMKPPIKMDARRLPDRAQRVALAKRRRARRL